MKRGVLVSSVRSSFCTLAPFLIRWIPENGEMNWELSSGIPDNISACFSLYINFNRYHLCSFIETKNKAGPLHCPLILFQIQLG